MRTKIAIVIFIMILGLGLVGYKSIHASDVLRIGVVKESASLPIIDAYDKGLYKNLEMRFEVVVYANENEMYSDANAHLLDGLLSNASTYIREASSREQFIAVSSIANDLYLIASPENKTVTKLNDIKGATIGVYNDNDCEFFIDLIINEQKFMALSLDRIMINDPINRMELLDSNSIDFCIMQSPFSDYFISRDAHILYKMPDQFLEQNFLVFDRILETENIDLIKSFIKITNDALMNRTLENYNLLIKKYFNYPNEVHLIYMPIKREFKMPDPDQTNTLLSWMYNTERINTKFKYKDIVTEQITINSK